MARNFLVDVNLNKRSLIAAAIESLGSAPGTPSTGQVYFDTVDNCLKVRNSSAWIAADASKVADGYIPIAKLGTDPLARANHTGTQSADSIIDGSTNKAYTGTEKTKLAGIATGATANSSDATLLARANHTGTQAAATISNFDTQVRTNRLDQMAQPTAAVPFNNQKITGLGAPTAGSNDVARIIDVENAVQQSAAGIDAKPSVRMATVANHGLTGLTAIDGVTPIAGDRVLVKNQSAGAANGVYVAAAGAWARAADADQTGEVTPGAFWYVEEGTTQAGTQWIVNNVGAITLGTTAITIVQFGAANVYTAGNGLLLTGSAFSAKPGTGVTVDGTGINVDFSIAVKKYAVNVGDASATVFVLTHNLNTRDVTVGVYLNSGSYEEVECDVEHTTVNTVTLRFATAPASNAYRAVIHG